MIEGCSKMDQRKVEIAASVMCIDWLNAGADLEVLEREKIDYLHFDIIDGSFASDFTMGTSIIDCFRKATHLRSEYHLMVEEPNRLFDSFEVAPDDHFIIHQECCRNLHRDLVALRRKGVKVGVAIAPGTTLEALEYIIEDVDQVLIMTVDPGYMGQALVPQTLRKVEKLRSIIDSLGLDIKISVDGNVSFENAPEMVAMGADILVGGTSGLFRKDMPLHSSIGYLREAIEKGLNL